MTIKSIKPWRRLVGLLEALTLLGLPFLRINGESALRFDIPTLRLHFFGISLWMEEFFTVLIAIIFITFFFLFITLLFGRIWCGWLCPQTVLADFTSFAEKRTKEGRIFSYLAIFIVSILVSANLIWYFVTPYDFIPALFTRSLGNVTRGIWVVLSVIIFLDILFLRHKFCATVCPYAKLQSVMYDDKTLVIAFDPERKDECIDCLACVRRCPVGIDIRKGLNDACINCAECIDECADIMGRKQKRSLIGYFWGMTEETFSILRQNVLMLGLATGISFIFFIALLLTRMPIDMVVLPNYSFPPRITDSGKVVNSYILSLKNRGDEDMRLEVNVTEKEGAVKIMPDSVLLKAGEAKKVPVYVTSRNIDEKERAESIELYVKSAKNDKVKVSGEANFIIPEKR